MAAIHQSGAATLTAPLIVASTVGFTVRQEETGFSAQSVHSLGKLNPNPALFNNSLHTFYGRVSPGGLTSHVSETERTGVEIVPIEDVRSLLLDGTIDHTLVCATLWRFLDWWQRDGESLPG